MVSRFLPFLLLTVAFGHALGTEIPVVSLNPSAANANENGPAAELTVSRTNGTTAALAVNYTVGGTAVNGTDYAYLNGTVILPAGSATAMIEVAPIQDAVSEPVETVVITLTAGSGYSLGSSKTCTVTLADDDQPLITVAASPSTCKEGSATPGKFIFTRLGRQAEALTVNFAVWGSATPGLDYTALPGSVTIPANSASVVLNVTPKDDAAVEPDETVVLTLAGGHEYLIGSPASATITINDNERPMLSVDLSDSTSSEPISTGKFRFNRLGNKAVALTVLYAVTGTATKGTDYATLPTTVTIPANAASAELTVTPIEDALVEGDETVTVTLLASAAYTIGGASAASLVIMDNEPGVTVTATDASASEQSTDMGVFTIART